MRNHKEIMAKYVFLTVSQISVRYNEYMLGFWAVPL